MWSGPWDVRKTLIAHPLVSTFGIACADFIGPSVFS